MPLKPNLVSTEADQLINLLKGVTEISFADAAKELGVPIETIENWASFLEEERLLSIKYKFTTPYLTYVDEAPEKDEAKKTGIKLFSEKKSEVAEDASEVEQLIAKSSQHLKIGEFKLAHQSIDMLFAKIKKLLESMAKTSNTKREDLDPKLSDLSARLKKAEELAGVGKFDIARGMYDEALARTKQLLEEAKLERKQHESDTLISKDKAKDVNALFDTAYKMLEQGRLDDSKRVYSQLKGLYYNLPQDFMERKNELEQDLMKLNKDLATNMERLEVKSMNNVTAKVREQMAAALGAIKKKDFEKANTAYEIIKQEFEKMPAGFLEEKRQLRSQIIGLYEVLVVNRRRMLLDDMTAKSMRIDAMLDGIKNNMAAGNINGAIALYNQVQALYSALPMGFLKEKIDIQKRILKVYYNLSSDYKKLNMRMLDTQSAEISKLLAQMQDSISKGSFKDAEKTYGEIKQRFSKLPKGFMQEKTGLQSKILKAYADLVTKSEEVTTREIDDKIFRMTKLVSEAEQYLKTKRYDMAHNIYADIIALYNNLPTGFIKSKAELRTRILAIYRELTINYDQPFLRKADKSSDQAYHQVLKIILDIHHGIGKGDFGALESGYRQIESIVETVEFDLEQKTRLTQEIGKLGEEYVLLRKVNSLESLIAQKNMMKLKLELSQIMRMKQRLRVSSPEDKMLFDYVDHKFRAYFAVLKNSQASSASFASMRRRVPALDNRASIHNKIAALKAQSRAVVLNPAGGKA